MDEAARYERAKDVFLGAVDLEGADLDAHLDRECGGDDGLRAQVRALLEHDPGREVTSLTAATPTAADFAAAPAADSAADSAAAPAGSTTRIGPYRVLHEIGRGGMGIVYLAARETQHFTQRVAIKVLRRGTDTEEVLRRFDLERQLLAAMNHPGIARLYDAGETDDGLPYIAMEYVEGRPLDVYCDQNRLDIPRRLELFAHVCEAVHHAHQNLVVHRDLKPGNILVTEDGQPKLLDFGIAKIVNPQLALVMADPTRPHVRIMTPEYASPEQARGGPITTASDVYALGVILYELVSGHRPYELTRRVGAEVERIICEQEPPRPSHAVTTVLATDDATRSPEAISRSRSTTHPQRLRRRLEGDIDNIVLMAMRKEPPRRYASAEQLAEDLQRHLDGRPVIAARDSLMYRAAKFVRRNRVTVATVAVVAVALVAGLAVASTGWRAAESARARTAAALLEAQRQREEATRQRGRAERRFEEARALARSFMFDFHDRIKALDGSLETRELLVATALEYLQAVADEVADDPDLALELAEGYCRVAEIQGGLRSENRGDAEAALASWTAALALVTPLAEAEPDDANVHAMLTAAHTGAGDALDRLKRRDEALDHRRAAVETAERLAHRDLGDTGAARRLAVALQSLGDVLASLGRTDESGPLHERSLAIRTALLEAAPDDPAALRDLGGAYGRLAARFEDAGDLDASLAQRRREEALRRRFVAIAPDKLAARGRRDLGICLYWLGTTLNRVQRHPEALAPLEESIALLEAHRQANPHSDRGGDVMLALGAYGDALVALGRIDEALPPYLRRLELAEIAGATPTTLAQSHARLAALHAQRGDHDRAVHSAEGALQALGPTGPPQKGLRFVHATRMECLRLLGKSLGARGSLTEARLRLESARQLGLALRAREPSYAYATECLIETLHDLANVAAGEGDGEAAAQLRAEALALTADATPAQLRGQAAVFARMERPDVAAALCTRALEMLEKDGGAASSDLRRTLETDLETYRRH